MNKDKRKGWLRELKVGDKVACDFAPAYSKNKDYTILTITKITPTGRIYAGHYKFDHEGYELGSKSNYSYGIELKIEPLTDEIVDMVEKQRLIKKLKQVDFDKLTLEKLRKIIEITK